VSVSAETAQLLGGAARLVSGDDGCFVIRGLDAPPPPALPSLSGEPPLPVLRRYLMPPLAARTEAEDASFTAEHRRVTAIFVNVVGAAGLLQAQGEDECLRQVNWYLQMVLSNLERQGGYLAGSDAAETSDKLIVLFGAPVAGERDELAALRFALDLDAGLEESGLDLRHRIGVSTGYVFAGEIGSSFRREYTVIGDSVNLSARLMAAADVGQIYVSAPTAERAHDQFALRRLRPLTLKGKSKPVPAFRLEGVRAEAPVAAARRAVFVGRERETAALVAHAEGARPARTAWAYVTGDPGMGKSRLIDEAAERVARTGWRRVTAAAHAHLASSALALWTEPLRAVLEIPADAPPDDTWAALVKSVERLAPDSVMFAPLIAEVLSIPAGGDELRYLDAKQRRSRLTSAIIGVVRGAAAEAPLLLTIEDVHHADAASLELLAAVLAADGGPIAAWLTSRARDVPEQLSSLAGELALQLDELPHDAARSLAAALGEFSDDAIRQLVQRAQGNPLFIEEIALSGAAGDEANYTISEVIMARLDRLPHEEKMALRAAAVEGALFKDAHVATLLRRDVAADASGALRSLSERGFVRESHEEHSTHAFAHGLTQEVLYETIPYARRREMHRSLAQEIERTLPVESLCGTLLHHYERAGDGLKSVTYGLMTGDRAAQIFANQPAMEHYSRVLELLGGLKQAAPADRSIVLEKVGDCLEAEGRHEAARQAFLDALEQWRQHGGKRRRSLLPVADAPAREALLCRRIAVSYERGSDYDASLAWLDDATSLLPDRAVRAASMIHASRSMSLFRKGLYTEAIEWGRRAVAGARRTGDKRALAYAHNMLANSHLEAGALGEAIGNLDAALRLYAEAGDVYGQAAANNNLGNCYQARGDLAASVRHYEIALEQNLRVGNDATITRNNLGEALLMQGRIDEAMQHLEYVVATKDKGLTAVAGLSEVNLSRCYVRKQDLGSAEAHLKRGTRLLRSVGASGLLAEARLQLAELRLAQGRPDDALREARGSLRAAQTTEAKLLEVAAERLVGVLEAERGLVATGLTRIANSAELARRIQSDYEEARSIVALARSAERAGERPPRIASRLARAVAMLDRIGARADFEVAGRLLETLQR
jgi:class 3 adenylate cyclase/tetratricopeptide (TPR) repeat protein